MNGFYVLLKSTDMTSSDAVIKLRGILRRQTGEKHKVGHLGTLDPGGSGVLPIAVGSAVKLFDYLLDKPKVYRAQFVWGTQTDTLDSYGRVVAQGVAVDDVNKVMQAAAACVGTYDQMPPAYSAKSVDGVRAYDLARRGIQPDLKPKRVQVRDIRLVSSEGNRFTFDIACSGGTYIRSICRDMATAMGTVGYMSMIIRLSVADWQLSQAVTLQEIEADREAGWVPLTEWTAALPMVDVPEDRRVAVQNGVPYALPDTTNGLFGVRIGEDLWAIGTQKDGWLKVICRL